MTRYDADQDELAALLAGEPSYRVRQVWDGLYRPGGSIEGLTSLPVSLRHELSHALPYALEPAAESTSDGGDTVKSLWRLDDGALIETVLMEYRDRSTICVSTQAGCAMACAFCATGQMGYERNLTTGEIVEQVLRAWTRSRRPRQAHPNVVFMGMGEPLANYDNVWRAIRRLHNDAGISARNLTVSTVGIVPGIRRMAAEPLPVNLAVSLHAANDALRREIVPINARYPIDAVVTACEEYYESSGRRVSFEWAMIDGVNDRPSDAVELAAIARRLRAHVNLIPLNPTPGYPVTGTPRERVLAFRERLRQLGVNATVRRNRGTEIDAACGQLRATAAVTITARPHREGSAE